MFLQLFYSYPLAVIHLEYPLEQLVQQLCRLDIFGLFGQQCIHFEVESLLALLLDLLQHVLLTLILHSERVFSRHHVVQADACCPCVCLVPDAILGEELRCHVLCNSDYLEIPLSPSDDLGQRKVVQVSLVFLVANGLQP